MACRRLEGSQRLLSVSCGCKKMPFGVHREKLASIRLQSPDLKLARKGMLSCSVGACGRCPASDWSLGPLATHCSRVTGACLQYSAQYAASSMHVEACCAKNGFAGCPTHSSHCRQSAVHSTAVFMGLPAVLKSYISPSPCIQCHHWRCASS